MKASIQKVTKSCSYIVAILSLLSLSACMQDNDDYSVENADDLGATADYVGETNFTIASVKKAYSSVFANNNTFRKVDEDVIFEGVVVANDCSENFYQATYIMDIRGRKDGVIEADSVDGFCIPIKNMKAFPYLQLGQRVKVNCRGLYVGNYSYVCRVGEPYFTSSGNLRLGPMLAQQCATNIELVGKPDKTAKELTPIVPTDAWLKDSKNKSYASFPLLVTLTGYIAEADGTAIWAPEELQDAGYGVDRTLVTSAGRITVRNSTSSEFGFQVIPQGTISVTGILTCYGSDWQIIMRDEDDLIVK